MRKVQIVTDSNCHIPESLRHELGIHVVQLPYVWDGVTYLDETDMGPREFFSKLRQSDTIPTTSAPTPGSFRELFEDLAKSGDPILVIHVGSEFSHTFKTAELAKAMLPGIDIHLIDSHSNALGMGFQVLAVARAAREGKDLEDLIVIADQARASTGVIFLVKDVKYIHRGGRINLGQRIIASSLNLVPIMEIRHGPVELIHIARSYKKAMGKMVDIVKDRLEDGSPIRIGVHHADNEADAYELRKTIEDLINPDELILEQLNPILGIHTGPGALGLAYCLNV
ncbi:MAG: DegV family EDD domain-containing protein [Anaerolineales bacterium]|nr:DegV family EDD domain-containing protein [Anaerolineales bacterium]